MDQAKVGRMGVWVGWKSMPSLGEWQCWVNGAGGVCKARLGEVFASIEISNVLM